MAKFGLQLHAEKTRLIEFGQFAERNRKQRGEGKPETITFLGFTHYCGKRSNGTFVVGLKTAKKQVVAKLRDIKALVVQRMNLRISPENCFMKLADHLAQRVYRLIKRRACQFQSRTCTQAENISVISRYR